MTAAMLIAADLFGLWLRRTIAARSIDTASRTKRWLRRAYMIRAVASVFYEVSIALEQVARRLETNAADDAETCEFADVAAHHGLRLDDITPRLRERKEASPEEIGS